MIDIQRERGLSLTQASQQSILPQRRRGKRPHVATLYRWAQRGLRGVRLETIRVGGTLCTSVEAIQRFFERLSIDEMQPTTSSKETAEDAERILSELGI